jgi:Zn-dependent oligopeptidase
LDPEVPLPRLRLINDAHLAEIGADPAALRIAYDIVPRPDRPVIPTAFTVSLDIARRTRDGWQPARPWVFATYAEGGLGNLEELLHESGHALHYAALRARPAQFSWPADQTAFVEAVADVVGWTVHEPAFLARHLGTTVSTRESVIARYWSVVLDACWTLFELELHRHPDRAPNDAWAEIMEADLGVVGHPEWSWWAHRGQLIDGPGYLASYALGAVMVAAVRARIRQLRGDWATGDPGWYAFVSERLLRFGGARTPRSILPEFLGCPLTAEALLADVERAG